MKIRPFRSLVLLTLFCISSLCCFSPINVSAQQTGNIGTGTGNGLYHGPIYRFSNSSTSYYSKNMIMYTEAELLAAGVTIGSQITSLAWYKTSAFSLTNGASGVLTLSLKDGSALTEFPSGANLVNLAATGFTVVATVTYNTTSNNLPNTAGWVTVPLSSPFTYNGGSMEVYADWVLSPGAGNPSDGAFNWQNHSTSYRTLQMFSGSPITSSGTTYRYNLRGDLQVGFSSLACTDPVAAGNATKDPITSVCPNTTVDLDLSGNGTGSGISYEWESSPNNAAGSYVSIGPAQTTASISVQPLTSTWYRCKVVCSGGTPAYATPVEVLVDEVSVDLGGDTTYCEGNPAIVLNAGNPGSSYLWDDGSTAQTRMVNTAGAYHVTVTSSGGCVGSDTVDVSFSPAATGDFTTTEGTNGTVSFEATGTGVVTYFWEFGANNATATGSTASYTYGNNGFYNVTLNMINDCGDTTKVTRSVTVSTVTVGINEIIKDAKVSIFPNPARDLLMVRNESGLSFEHIKIVDVSGRSVHSVPAEGTHKDHKINISHLNSGTYYLQILTPVGRIIKAFSVK